MLGWQQYGPSQCLWKNDQPEYHEIFIHRYRMLYVMRFTDGKTGAIGKRERLIVKLLKDVASASAYLSVDFIHGDTLHLGQDTERPKGCERCRM